MWKTFLSAKFRKDPSIFFLLYELNFNKQRPEKAGRGKTKWSYKISSDNRQEQVTGYEGKRQRWPWLNLKPCVWSSYLTTLLTVISCSHASKMSLVPLTQENKDNSVALPTAPTPALMPVLTGQFWGQTKTAPLSTQSYTIVHQAWLPPQQSETDAESACTSSKNRAFYSSTQCPPKFEDAWAGLWVPCQHPDSRERTGTSAHTTPPLATAVNAPEAAADLQRRIPFVCFPDCSVKPLNPTSRVKENCRQSRSWPGMCL